MIIWNRKTAAWQTIALAALLGSGASCLAFVGGVKAQKTPCYWQRDTKFNYPNEGRYHCAPVAVAEGLVYLATARGYKGLVKSTGRMGQVALVNELAGAMKTNPDSGTKAEGILTGLGVYIGKKGYSLERLEVATWAGLSQSNRKFLVGAKPKMGWLSAAANDPDTIVLGNVGWYKKEAGGTYTRLGGHWFDVVGTGARPLQFDIRNPAWESKRQRTDAAINLKLVDENFTMTYSKGRKMALRGYYECDGPGLPVSKKAVSATVLDGVIVFKLKKNDA